MPNINQSVTTLTVFEFQGNRLRVIEHNENPWFIGNEACRALGIANSRDAIARLSPHQKDDVGITDAIGRMQKTNIVSEGGLYKLAFQSRKPEAQAFTDLVVDEILPAIRKTGSYIQPLELLEIKDTMASLEEEVNNLRNSVEMLQGPRQMSSDPIEQAIYTTLATRGEPITASELKWRCPETRELTSKYITKVCKRMARAKIIKKLAPVGTQYVPRFFA